MLELYEHGVGGGGRAERWAAARSRYVMVRRLQFIPGAVGR